MVTGILALICFAHAMSPDCNNVKPNLLCFAFVRRLGNLFEGFIKTHPGQSVCHARSILLTSVNKRMGCFYDSYILPTLPCLL